MIILHNFTCIKKDFIIILIDRDKFSKKSEK